MKKTRISGTQDNFSNKEDHNSKDFLTKGYNLIDFIKSVSVINVKTGECEVITLRR